MIEKTAEAPMLRPSDVGRRLGLTPGRVKLLPPAELPFYRVNTRGDRRYRPEDVEAYLAARRVAS